MEELNKNMNNNILDKNLNPISKYNPMLAERIRQHSQIDKSFNFEESAVGEVILSYDDTPLHSTYNSEAEAKEIFEQINCDGYNTIHVIFGLGLGYLFKRFTLSAKGKIILYEPNLDILRITLEVVDFSEELSRKKVLVANTPQELDKVFEALFFDESDITLSFLPSYQTLFPDETNKLLNDLGFLKGLFNSNYKNMFDQAHEWTISGINNIPNVMMNSELEDLRDKFKNIPAVIISAGPSLDKNIDLLHEYRDKVVVFSVGTASKAVQKHNIIPDFLTIVEKNNCTEQVKGVDTSQMNMILQPMTHKNFHEMPTKNKFNYYAKNDFTVKWINKHLKLPLDDYENKGTVSLCALFSAMIMGCNPIITIGQDLAYSEGRCYSVESAYGNIKCELNPETGTYEVLADDLEEFSKQFNCETIEETKAYLDWKFHDLTKNLYFVKGLNGKMIPTSSSYATFIKYFETAADEFKHRAEFINATEGGAYLEGFNHQTLKHSLEQYAKTSVDVKQTVNSTTENRKKIAIESKNDIIKELNKTIKTFEDLTPLFIKSGDLIFKLRKMIKNNRLNNPSFSKHFTDIINNFLTIESKFIINNIAIHGLICSQYMKFSHFLQNLDGNIELESIEKFLDLAHEFFITAYQILNNDMFVFKRVREQLCDSCHSKS